MRRALATATAAATVVHTIPALAPIFRPVCDALDIDRRLDRDDAVALTFDDGPHPVGTPAVLELLRDRGARATFFLAGEQVERNPALAREIVDAGHAVALHCHRHRVMLRLTPAQVRDDLDRGAVTIADATGRMPTVQRAPLGIYSAAALAIVRGSQWRPLLWSQWGRDWSARSSPASITSKLTDRLAGGDVLLLHDSDVYSDRDCWRNTVAALPAVLDRIEARGLITVPITA